MCGHSSGEPWVCTLIVNEPSSAHPALGLGVFPHPLVRVQSRLLSFFSPEPSGFWTIYMYVCILVFSGQLLMHIQILAVRVLGRIQMFVAQCN